MRSHKDVAKKFHTSESLTFSVLCRKPSTKPNIKITINASGSIYSTNIRIRLYLYQAELEGELEPTTGQAPSSKVKWNMKKS